MISLADIFEIEGMTTNHKYKEQFQNKKNSVVPLVDKYRPKKLDDVVYQTDVIKMLKKTLETGDLPHMLFYGPPGTGKTSTILAFVKELFGPKLVHDRVIELNASDERGIGIVRDKIIRFAKSAIGGKDPNYPCPPYKIIILDEADAMTTEAQAALRKIIEDYSRITRFFLSCNYINQIIDPIISRCSKFRFKPLDNDTIIDKLSDISQKENIPISKENIEHLIRCASGDMRKAIMLLQNLSYIAIKNNSITTVDIYETAGWIPDKILLDTINKIINSKTQIDLIVNICRDIYKNFPVQSFYRQLLQEIALDNRFSDKKKSLISLHVSRTEKMLLDRANEYLQLLASINFIHGVFNGFITDFKLEL
jgi:replication factor C subunit 2/4